MRYLLSLTACLIALSSAAAQAKIADISVVKTWKDLQNVPAIDLGGGVKIHLGLEADKLPQWSGGLLYCLTEGFTPPNEGEGIQPFGPVNAAFRFDDGRPEIKMLKDKVSWLGRKKDWPKGSYLFARGLAVDRVGKYLVRITDNKNKVLAKATLEGTRERFHPWMPWQQEKDKANVFITGIVVPTVDGFGPVGFIEPGKTKKGNLPTFWPDETKPSLTLKMDRGNFVLRSETEITTSWPGLHVLARWWVNGRPFLPKQSERLWLYNNSGLVWHDKEMRLRPEFPFERLGAKPGDKIGLQLIYCAGLWAWCDSSTGSVAEASRKDGENVRLSNRIEFVAPKVK